MNIKLLCCIILIFVLITIVLFGLDIYYYLKFKLCRRFFEERVFDASVWKKSLLSKNQKWLIKTPTILKSDNRRLIILDYLNGELKRDSIQSWQKASLYISLCESNSKAKIKAVDKSIKRFSEAELKALPSKINTIDFGLLCYGLLCNNVDNDSIYEKMLEIISDCTNENDMILYRANAKNSAFVDTIGLVCPFLCKCGLDKQRSDLISLAEKQLDFYYENAFDRACSLPFHAVQLFDGAPLGICGWARGFAWYLLGLMESYLTLKDTEFDNEKWLTRIRAFADLLLKLQLNSGAYSWQLLNKTFETDSSATAVFGWYMAKCYKLFDCDEYLKSAKLSRDFLMRVTTKSGAIDFCQGDTKRIGVYSTRFEFLPFAQGYALRLQEELDG